MVLIHWESVTIKYLIYIRQLMGKFLDELTIDQKQAFRECIKIQPKLQHPWWGI
jgi:hypothetical protein